ncbi:twin-arginine translocation signal domain-containing protein [candidate division KSB1 bacterium]|nr:twin-arginine translocation signal domain-containing protein [candidate division KSB1 bacterium]
MCCECHSSNFNRRDFMKLSTLGVVGAGLGLSSTTLANSVEAWDPDRPMMRTGQKLVVQPMLMYQLYKRREATSWRPWGGLHTEADIEQEENRIKNELTQMAQKIDFPLEILPLIKIRSKEEALKIRDVLNYDVPLVYAATGDGNILESCFSEKRNNIIFLRHRSGPVYLWYEITHNRFLRKGGQNYELDSFRNPAGMTIHDVIVDDYDEISYKLRALFAVKNFIGQKIIALGGSQGWCFPKAPEISREKFKMNIQDVSYDELGKRIQLARSNKKLMTLAEKEAEKYLNIKDTPLKTDKKFVTNAFILYRIFKDFMNEYGTNAFTINECMGTVIPMSETTACLPLSLLNDEGLVAFCESDFNVIPSGILLYYITGKPVFLNDPTYPHHGLVTCAHCTAPRRLDGKNYAPTPIMTHFESDYGAAPKVELPLGTEITMICPDGGQKEWLGFKGKISENPYYDICRAQYDIQIEGDWKKLLQDHRGFHWMMACGDYLKELEYAVPKIGVNWNQV